MKSLFLDVPLVALGGAIGAVARYLVGVGVERLAGEHFPFGTLIVNVTGCFLIGAIGQFAATSHTLPPAARTTIAAGLLVGFLGALTTFSAFGNETFRHFEAGRSLIALSNIAANLLLGLTAVWLGALLCRTVIGGGS